MIVLMLSHTLRNILVSPVSASAGIRDYQIWMIAQFYKEICCTGRDRTHKLSYLSKHEKDHFGQPGHFVCPVDHCGFVTKRWSDLRRHSSTIHCTKAKKFPCSVPWCKYTGENGFTRRDKLTSHFNNVHKGVKAAPRGATLAVKPALCKDIASESGTASTEKHDL